MSATASASGGNSADSSGDAPAAGSGEDSSVDSKVQKESGDATTKESDAKVGTSDQQSATSGEGKSEDGQGSTSDGDVAVAAAIGVDVSQSNVQAYVPRAVSVTATGSLTVAAVNNTDGLTSADGSAVGSATAQVKVGVGAAVAISLVHSVDDAILGSSTSLSPATQIVSDTPGTYDAGAVSITALKTDLGGTTPTVPAASPPAVADGSTPDDATASSQDSAPAPTSADPAGGRADLYGASATSGAGGSNVGVAGSLAVDLIDSEAIAQVTSGTVVPLSGHGSVVLSSDDETSSIVLALPAGDGATGGKVGVGASIALNIVATRSLAELSDGSAVTGAGSVALTADASHGAVTQADQGSSGGVAVTPVVALSLIDDETQATIGALSGGLTTSGDVSVTALQASTELTTAAGTAAGGKAAVGAALAIALIDDSVVATTSTSIGSGGSVGFSASGASLSVVSATASASGGNGTDSSGASTDSDGSVDDKIQKQSGAASTKESDAKVGTSGQQGDMTSDASSENGKGSTNEGAVAVAAAISVDVAQSNVQAYVPKAVSIAAAGPLTVAAVNNTDGEASADGSAVGAASSTSSGSKVGIGAALAISLVHSVDDATLGSSTSLSPATQIAGDTPGTYDAGSVSITALKTDLGVLTPTLPGATQIIPTDSADGGRPDQYSTSAMSGASGTNIGLAGALAANIIFSDSTAEIANGVAVNIVSGGSGSVTIAAEDEMSATATAAPTPGSGASGGKLGVGASVALNTISTSSEAALDQGVALTGAVASLAVTANSSTDTDSESSGGAAGGTAIDAVVAMSILSETTSATIASGNALSVGGAVEVSAISGGANTAKATGKVDKASSGGSGGSSSSSSSVGVGAAVAVITGTGVIGSTTGNSITSSTTASLDRDVATTTGDLTVSASSTRSYDAESSAVAGGAVFSDAMSGGDDSTPGGGSAVSGDTLNTSQAQSAMTKAQGAMGSGSGGKLSVAAAIGAAIIGDQVSAEVVGGSSGNDRTLTIGGKVIVSATNAGDVLTLGDGATVGSDKVGIGIGAALSIVDNSTSAAIGDFTHVVTPGAVSVLATSTENQDPGFADRLSAEAMSGATAKKIAVAGALAIGISTSTTSASIGDTVAIDNNAGRAGGIQVQADNTGELAAKAWAGSFASQGTGVGASIAVVISTDSYSASIGQDGAINAGSVTVSATNEKVDNSLLIILDLINQVDADAGSASSTFGTNTSDDAAAVLAELKGLGGTAQSEPLLGENNYYTEVIAGAASGDQVSFAGGFAIQVIDNSATASIGQNTRIRATANVDVEATDNAGSKTLVGGLSASAGATAAGISSAIITNSSTIDSHLADGVQILNSTAVSIKAGASQDIDVFEISAAAGDENGAVGVLGVITSLTSVTAYAGKGVAITSSGAVDISAANTISVLNIAGAIGLGGEDGLGGTAVATTIENSAQAYVDSDQADQSSITAGALDISATTSESLINVAIAGAAAGENGFAGVATPLTQVVSADAYVGQYATVRTTGAAQVDASDGTLVVNVGGAVAGGGDTAVGGTAAISSIINDVYAYVDDNSTVDVGSLAIDATGSQNAVNVAIAGTAGGSNAISGVLTPVTQVMNVYAYAGQNDLIAAATGNVDIGAKDTTLVINFGGVLAIGGDNGVGGTAAVSTLSDTTEAYIGDGSTVDAAGAVSVAATTSENVLTTVVAGAAGGNVGVGVALSSSIVLDTTEAYIGHAVIVGGVTEPTSLAVFAQDATSITDFAGTLGVGGDIGVAAGADVNVLTKNTYAWIGRDSVSDVLTPANAATVHVDGGDVSVDSESSENVYSLVGGLAAGGDAGVAGSVAIYALYGNTLAGIGDDDTVDATGNVAVLADDANTLNRIAGSAGLGGDVGVGASLGVSVAIQTTQATIGVDATVVALGQTPGIEATTGFQGEFSVYGSQALAVLPPKSNLSGTVGDDLDPTSVADAIDEGGKLLVLDRTTTPVQEQVRGVVVNATATNLLRSLAVSGAVGGDVGVTMSGDLPVVVSDTEATIGAGAKINTTGTPGAGQSVAVAAASDLYHLGVTGSVAGGGDVGVGAGAETNIFSNTTIADIGAGSIVKAAANIGVTAKASEDFAGTSVSAGLAGDVGVAGGVTGFAVNDKTYAVIDSNADANAGGSVVVAADDETRAVVTSGTIAIGAAAAGVGAGVGISVITKDTEAYIGADASVTALGAGSDGDFSAYTSADSANTTGGQGLLVQADSGESVMSVILAGAGGLYAGVAGVVSVEAIVAKTEAYIDGGAVINDANAGANGQQDVDVTARDSTVLSTVDGVAGVGIAGVGGAVDLAVIADTTSAFIGDGATLNAQNDVLVNAFANQATSSGVASVAGGIGGFSAAISVLAIANGPDPDQSSETTTSGGATVSGNADNELSDGSINDTYLSKSSNSNVTATSAKAQSYKSNLSASADTTGANIPSGTSATIGAATMDVGGTVSAKTQDDINAVTADGAVTAAAGLGAGIGITAVDVASTASIGANANITAGAVDVSASSSRVYSATGFAATAVGVAASAVTVGDGSSTKAEIGDGALSAGGAVSVAATNTTTASLTTISLAVGTGGGLDLLVLTPSTTATIDGGATVASGTATAGDVTVDASTTITLPLTPLVSGAAAAVVGGLGAGVTIVVMTPTTDASIGDGAVVSAGAIGGGNASTLGSVVVDASSAETLYTVGAGLAIGGDAAGALTVYTLTGPTTAEIGAAKVTATGNVAVLADSTTSGDILVGGVAIGGASAGGAIGVSVLDTTTTAEIDASADVTAYGLSSIAQTYVASYNGAFQSYASGASIQPAALSGVTETGNASEDPLTTSDVASTGEKLLLEERDASPVDGSAKGVIVNAANADAIRTISVSGALGGSAIALSGDVPVIIADTQATIGAGAKINQRNAVSAGSGQSVVVAAANDFYDLGVIGSVAGGGAVGAGAGFSAVYVQDSTHATIGASAQVNAADDVAVTAQAGEDFATMAASGALGGAAAIAGGISVIAVDDSTKALIDHSAQIVANNNVAVIADDETRTATVAGALAVSVGFVSVGGAVSVVVIDKDTEATIAGSAQVTGKAEGGDTFVEYTDAGANPFTQTQPGQGVLVDADSGESLFTLAMAGGVAQFGGIAGAISVQIVNTTTLAAIDTNALINTAGVGSSKQDVDVASRDSTGIVSIDGALAGGLIGGLSGSVDVGVVTNTVGATIGNGATVDAGENVFVDALANKAISSTVVSAAAGGAALAAGISIYSIGDGVDPNSKGGQELQSNSQSVGGYAGSQASGGGVVSGSIDDTSSNANAQSAAGMVNSHFGSVDVSGDVNGNSAVAGTSATIGSATINAVGNVAVGTQDAVNSQAITGALGLGLVGVGAGIGIVADNATNTANISGASTLSENDLSVAANTTHSMSETSFAGAVALIASAEADVAVATDTSTTNAFISGSTILASGSVDVTADADRQITASGKGVAAALDLAVGLSLATADIEGTAQAYVQGATIGTTGSNVGSVTIGASSADSAEADALAVAGGIGVAADGSVATATASPHVTVYVDDGAINASGAVLIEGQAQDDATASAKGYAFAIGGAAGASIATATVSPDVAADVRDSSTIDAVSLEVDAFVGQSGAVPFVSADATGTSGAVFFGFNATDAIAQNEAQAIASAEHSTLTTTGALTFQGLVTTNQFADGTGIAAAGLLAVGFDISTATSNTAAKATFSDLNALSAGSLKLSANGNDTNVADATAGSGGVIAGSAASATTSSSATTDATIDNDTTNPTVVNVAGGNVDILATHTATFSGAVDSTQAAVVGASGSTLTQNVSSNVDAHLGNYVQLAATNLTIDAQNITHNYFLGEPTFGLYPGDTAKSSTFDPDSAGWNIDSGSGGILAAPAGDSNTTVSQITNASIGSNASVHLLAPSSGVSLLFVQAYNEAIVHQKATIDSGGAIAIAEADATISVTDNATVSFGDRSSIVVDIGDIEAAAWGNADLDVRSAATTYGVAGAPSGKAYANYNGSDILTVGLDVQLQSTDGIDPIDGSTPTHGTVTLAAGDSPAGIQSSLVLNSEVDLYNNTAIPIDSTPDAQSNVTINATLTIEGEPDQITNATNPANDTHYGVNAAGDIALSADQGNMSTTAAGAGTNIYLQALSEAASAISNLFGGGDVTFKVTGGSTEQNGASALAIDGLVDTGIQKDKSLTISYATSDTLPNAYSAGSCNVTTTACLAAPVNGEIPATITGPFPEAEDILERLATLQSLLQQYGQDPIAAGAYASEITFLETKLVALGLGKFNGSTFVSGNFSNSETPKQVAQAQLTQDQSVQTTLSGNFVSATTVLVSSTDPTIELVQSNIAAFFTRDYSSSASTSVEQSVTAAYGQLSTLNNFASNANKSDATFQAAVADTSSTNSALVQQGVSDITTITNDAANNTALQTSITQLSNTIVSDAASNNSTGAASAAAQIATDLSIIASHNTEMAAKSSDLLNVVTKLQTDLTYIENHASDGSSHDKGITGSTTVTTALTNISNLLSPGSVDSNGNLENFGDPRNQNTAIVSLNASIASETTTLTTQTNSGGTPVGPNSLGQWTTLLDGLGAAVAADTTTYDNASNSTAPNLPQSFYINVPDTVARLGNIALNAESVTSPHGTGILSAPGNASITITNNTADTLELGSLTVPSYDAGRIRFNGVLVNSDSDISALNPGGAAANFTSVVTSATSGKPSITITSNYEWQAPTSPSSLYYLNNEQVAPDIQLTFGSVINNLNGPVSITSNSGNIYINGSINAGSVNILAKNGDLVTSYVDGFDNVGGDPASQSPTLVNGVANQDGLGTGIVANGEIFISARYLNINSTIQSGIANWNLDLETGQLLTAANPISIGIPQSVIDGLVQAYQTAIAQGGNPSSYQATGYSLAGSPIYLNLDANGIPQTIVQGFLNDYKAQVLAGNSPTGIYTYTPAGGQTVTFNAANYTPSVRLEFTTAQANAYVANPANNASGTTYQVISAASTNGVLGTIGASYDPASQEYVVSPTVVHGGDIQLYGQIMDTSPTSGQLNVLDGFGTINITNNTNLSVVLSTLDTGADPTGTLRGTAGIIDITDVHLDSAVNPSSATPNQVDVLETEYTRNYNPANPSSAAVVVQQRSGVLLADGVPAFVNAGVDSGWQVITTPAELSQSTAQGYTADRSSQYDPLAAQRYVWTTGTDFSSTTDFQHDETDIFHSGDLSVDNIDSLDFTSGPNVTNEGRLANGTYLTTYITQNASSSATTSSIHGVVISNTPGTTPNGNLEQTPLVTSTYDYLTSSKLKQTGESDSCDWWTLCIASNKTIYYELDQTYTQIVTSSLKADYAIGVNFIGSNVGAINVASNANVVLTNDITNVAGKTTITATGSTNGVSSSIIQGSTAALVTSKSIDLAAAGFVGGLKNPSDPSAPLNAPVAVFLTQAGTLNGALTANAGNGDVSITTTGDLSVQTVTATGDVTQGLGSVTLFAGEGIVGANGSALIQADEVNLTAQNGAILGSGGAALTVNTGYTSNQSLRQFGDPAQDMSINSNPYYGLKASGSGDINIASAGWSDNSAGIILVDTVVSTGGNVTLTSPGQILDNNPVQTVNARTDQQLLDYWNDLNLLASPANTAKQQATLAAYEQSTEQEYDQYWQIRQTQSDGGRFTIPTSQWRSPKGRNSIMR